jgi:hypothetical protein
MGSWWMDSLVRARREYYTVHSRQVGAGQVRSGQGHSRILHPLGTVRMCCLSLSGQAYIHSLLVAPELPGQGTLDSLMEHERRIDTEL